MAVAINSNATGTFNTGTSGATIPLLDGVNTWSGKQTFNGGMTQVGSTTSTSSTVWNQFYLAPAPVGATSGAYTAVGASIQYNSASDNSGAVNGISVTADLYGAGVSNQTSGIRATARSLGNGGAYSAGSLYGGLFSAQAFGTSSFDHVIGLKINGADNAGNVTYQCGLYIADQTNDGAGTITLQDAIHIEGKSGTDTAVNSIGFGNGTSGLNAHIFSPTANVLALVGTGGITFNGIPALTSGVYASKPGAPVAGQTYFATDIGTSGVTIIYTGTIWKPLGGVGVVYHSGVAGTSTSSTSETNIGTFTIPAGLLSANGSLRLTMNGKAVGVVDSKIFKIYYSATSGGAAGTLISSLTLSTANLSVMLIKTLTNRASVSSQITSSVGTAGTGQSSGADIATTINTAAASYFNVTGQLTTGTDSMNIESLLIEWIE